MINCPDYAERFVTPIYSMQLSTNDILCRDEDNDGYYNWGIGSKPAHCPPCPNERDGNDNNPNVGPLNADGYCSQIFPYTESYENGFEDWFQMSDDDFDWTRQSGDTPTSGTGPSAAQDGTYYIYVESSAPNYPYKEAAIATPTISFEGICSPQLKFYYHMYGSSIGSLNVYISTNLGSTWSNSIWSKSGNQGNNWYLATIDLSIYVGNQINIKFLATTGSSYTSDIAIDNIQIISDPPSSTLYVSSNQEWSDYRSVCTNIIIQNGATLTISGSTYLSTEASITVNSNSTLNIDAGVLRNGKIIINSGGKLNIEDGGEIILYDEDDISINLGGELNFTKGNILVIN